MKQIIGIAILALAAPATANPSPKVSVSVSTETTYKETTRWSDNDSGGTVEGEELVDGTRDPKSTLRYMDVVSTQPKLMVARQESETLKTRSLSGPNDDSLWKMLRLLKTLKLLPIGDRVFNPNAPAENRPAVWSPSQIEVLSAFGLSKTRLRVDRLYPGDVGDREAVLHVWCRTEQALQFKGVKLGPGAKIYLGMKVEIDSGSSLPNTLAVRITLTRMTDGRELPGRTLAGERLTEGDPERYLTVRTTRQCHFDLEVPLSDSISEPVSSTESDWETYAPPPSKLAPAPAWSQPWEELRSLFWQFGVSPEVSAEAAKEAGTKEAATKPGLCEILSDSRE